jgi:Mrp family chromosome partitioning ATPase
MWAATGNRPLVIKKLNKNSRIELESLAPRSAEGDVRKTFDIRCERIQLPLMRVYLKVLRQDPPKALLARLSIFFVSESGSRSCGFILSVYAAATNAVRERFFQGELVMANENQQSGCSAGQGRSKEDQDAAVSGSLQKIKNKIIVMSGKGGVGKTSTSVNLAIALAKKGAKVGIMDVDLHGPDVPRMLGLKGLMDVNAANKLTPMKYSDNLGAVSIESLSASKDKAIIWRGPIKYSAIRQFIGDVDWGDLDFLVIDSPPGTGDEPLTVAQTISDAKAVVVTTPQEVSLADVRKSISFCQTVNMSIFGLIENMSGLACPHCGEMLELFGCGGGERTANALNIPFLGKIPFDPRVVACGDTGTCFLDQYADSPVTHAFGEIAEKLMALA